MVLVTEDTVKCPNCDAFGYYEYYDEDEEPTYGQ
jgi:hypothetical protein